MGSYPFWKEKGHVFAEVDGRVALVDTGAWMCVSDRGEEHGKRAAASYNGATVRDLQKMVGVPFDYLMGLSAMYWEPVEFDLEGGRMVFDPLPRAKEALEAGLIGGFVPITLPGGHKRLGLFDSGAQISYIHSLYANDLGQTKPYTDFYPGHGEMTVPSAVVGITIADRRVLLNVGVLPDELKGMTDGLRSMILGNELLDHFIVRLDLPEQRFTVYPRLPRMLLKQAE